MTTGPPAHPPGLPAAEFILDGQPVEQRLCG
jgi:hypothetical protein